MGWLRNVGSALGIVQRAPRSLTRGRVIPDLSLWDQFRRIGGGLTPQQVSSIIREADTGDMRRLMDLANDSRQKDCHLQSVLQTAEQSVAGLDWELVLPDDANASERRACEWVANQLKETPQLPRLFGHQAGARYFGYAVTETAWAKSRGKLVPASFEFLAPRRFGFRQEGGLFVWRDEGMSYAGVDFRAEYPDRFIVSQPRVTGDVPCREGLVRVLMWAALFRNWTLSDWLKLGEIAWKPWRIGKYDKGATIEDIDHLTDILEQLTSNGVATHAEGTEIKIEWPGGGRANAQGGHASLFGVIASEMSKAVLGQTETTQSSSSSGYAQAQVHNEIRKDLREAAARDVASDVTRDLVAPMTRLNFAERIRPARLRFVTKDAMDFRAFATGVKDLVTAGAKIPHSYVYNEGGIAVPKDGEECLEMGAVDIPIDPKTGLPSEPNDDAEPKAKPAKDEETDAEADDAKDDGAA